MNGTATKPNESGSLMIGMGKRRETVSPSEVMYLAAEGNYSTFVRRRKRPVTASITLARYETTLPAFIRIHKRFMVNPAFVKELTPGDVSRAGAEIVLANGTRLPVSRRRLSLTQKRLIELVKRAAN